MSTSGSAVDEHERQPLAGEPAQDVERAVDRAMVDDRHAVEHGEVVPDPGLDDVRFVADHRHRPHLHDRPLAAGSRRTIRSMACGADGIGATAARVDHNPPVVLAISAATRSPNPRMRASGLTGVAAV